ncbi:MAG: Phthiodiolone/phenolphthiodiolone dimycocerosates ketoreductase [Actinomycetia bacterium]|nr:Phthiodiolone/phenolphthiodiolone dimycocerosates ketoreductase [Actinomycetes bacterium]
MDIGIVLQTDPPASKVIDLAVRADQLGFSHVWTFDSHVLWQEPYVIYSQILGRTERVVVGPMVTNPGTRDWTVTASHYATLNEMFGDRTVCGIGRGDSARRYQGQKPMTLDTLGEAIGVIRDLVRGKDVTFHGSTIGFPWWPGTPDFEVWMAGYGPKALELCGQVADGFILQLADIDVTAWMVEHVRSAAARAGRDPDALTICVAAPAYVGDDLAHMRDQCRWFGGMVGNHVADIVERYGADGGSGIPQALTDYIAGRKGYDYGEHGRAGNSHAEFVPDEIVDRFCILGSVDDHLAKLDALAALGVDQFAIYLQHDAKEATLEAYGSEILPQLQVRA